MALSCRLFYAHTLLLVRKQDNQVGGCPGRAEGKAKANPERPALQILVEVAIIQALSLKSDVG